MRFNEMQRGQWAEFVDYPINFHGSIFPKWEFLTQIIFPKMGNILYLYSEDLF